MTKKTGLIALIIVIFSTIASSQSVIGKWKTIDDDTGKAKSIVEIYKQNGKVFGKIINLVNRPQNAKPNPICTKCVDDRKDQKIIGIEIIRDMKKDGDEYVDGTIMDPENGKSYTCKLWVDEDDNNILKVRGYISFLYRTQTWHKVK